MDVVHELETKFEKRFAEMQYHILTLRREVDREVGLRVQLHALVDELQKKILDLSQLESQSEKVETSSNTVSQSSPAPTRTDILDTLSSLMKKLKEQSQPPEISSQQVPLVTKQEKIQSSFPQLGEIDGRLWIVPDYNDRYLAVFGRKACLALKDDVLKPIGFKFLKDLNFGPGWMAEKTIINILLNDIIKRNANFPTKIEHKIINRVDVLAFRLT